MLGDVLGDVAHEVGHLGASEHRRHLAHHHGAGAETLQHQADASERLGVIHEALDGRGIEVDHLGHQKRLGGGLAPGAGVLHLLVDEALMRGVLVDDDEAVAGLGDDVVLVQLRPRRPQRAVEQVIDDRGLMGARIGRRRLEAGKGGDHRSRRSGPPAAVALPAGRCRCHDAGGRGRGRLLAGLR